MPQLIESIFAISGFESLLPLAAIALVAVLLLGGKIGGGDRRE